MRKIRQQGQEIDAVYEQQDRVYYQLGKKKQTADNLNRGMWFTVCWEPIVNVVKSNFSLVFLLQSFSKNIALQE